MQTTVDKFGRVVIPKQVRERLGLQPGTPVQVHQQGDKVVLEAVRQRVELVKKGHVLVFPGEVVGDVTHAVRQMREERLRKFHPRSARGK
jgi:AbrB family looped-hinge helix DNA binding protein